MPLPPPRRESFHFSPTGTNPPDYSSLIALANDFSPGTLTFTQNEKAILKESYTISSTSSYSYSEGSVNPAQQAPQSTVPNTMSNCSASATTSAQAQERKVSSLKLTPITIPDPPVHLSSYLNPQPKITGSPPPTSLCPQRGPTLSPPLTQTALLSVHLGAENLKHAGPSNDTVELKVPDQAPNQTPSPAPSQVEMTKTPPAVPPRPSPAELLVHNLTAYCDFRTEESNDCVHMKVTKYNIPVFLSGWHQEWLKGNTLSASHHLMFIAHTDRSIKTEVFKVL